MENPPAKKKKPNSRRALTPAEKQLFLENIQKQLENAKDGSTTRETPGWKLIWGQPLFCLCDRNHHILQVFNSSWGGEIGVRLAGEDMLKALVRLQVDGNLLPEDLRARMAARSYGGILKKKEVTEMFQQLLDSGLLRIIRLPTYVL